MVTSCSTCNAPIVKREHLVVPGCGEQRPLWAETYRCGAVRMFGLIEGSGVARTCPDSGSHDAGAGIRQGAAAVS